MIIQELTASIGREGLQPQFSGRE